MPALRLVPPPRAAPSAAARRQRARHAPSPRVPGWTACGLPPSSWPAGVNRLAPAEPPTCRRCLALVATGGE